MALSWANRKMVQHLADSGSDSARLEWLDKNEEQQKPLHHKTTKWHLKCLSHVTILARTIRFMTPLWVPYKVSVLSTQQGMPVFAQENRISWCLYSRACQWVTDDWHWSEFKCQNLLLTQQCTIMPLYRFHTQLQCTHSTREKCHCPGTVAAAVSPPAAAQGQVQHPCVTVLPQG